MAASAVRYSATLSWSLRATPASVWSRPATPEASSPLVGATGGVSAASSLPKQTRPRPAATRLTSQFVRRDGGWFSPQRAFVHQATVGSSSSVQMAVKVGDQIPNVDLAYFNEDNKMETISTEELTKGKKVVLFAVPGAFTPTCSLKHLPGFIEKAPELKAKGVDTIACVSVNDAFVMQAWGKSVGTDGKVLLLADGSANLAKALGVELDLADKGLGIRSRRFSMLLDDGKVSVLHLEQGGAFTTSGADDILKEL